VTPTLSDDADQLTSMRLADTAPALTFPGAAGAVPSGVVADAELLSGDALPARSTAFTVYVYAVASVRPVSRYVLVDPSTTPTSLPARKT